MWRPEDVVGVNLLVAIGASSDVPGFAWSLGDALGRTLRARASTKIYETSPAVVAAGDCR